MATLVSCPICRTSHDFFAEPLGPFCSNRCKMVDLGQWMGEEYKISEPLDPEAFDPSELDGHALGGAGGDEEDG